MKVLISADIEGINGICDWDETDLRAFGSYFSNRMTKEVNAACKGITQEFPHAQILVKDSHGTSRNLDHNKIIENVSLLRGYGANPNAMVFGIDSSFDAAIFIGYHSAASTPGNPLAHTNSFNSFNYVKINDCIASEFLINRLTCLYNKVPVIMLSGDQGICREAIEADQNIVTVEAFEGYGDSVTSIHPQKILNELEKNSSIAIQRIDKFNLSLPKKFEIELSYKLVDWAETHANYPGATLESANIVRFSSDDYFEILKFYSFR